MQTFSRNHCEWTHRCGRQVVPVIAFGFVFAVSMLMMMRPADAQVNLWPNQPSGFTPLTERSFDAGVESGWVYDTSGTMTITTDSSAPKSAPNVGQAHYPVGVDSYAPFNTNLNIPGGLNYRQIYISFWLKVSSNWLGHKSGTSKIGYCWIHDNPTVYFRIIGSGSGPLSTGVTAQNVGAMYADSVDLSANVNDVPIVRGQWHRWEWVLRANDPGQFNGQIQWWIDGIKAGQYTNIGFSGAGQGNIWQILSWYPIWGGQGDSLAAPQDMYMDHFYASGTSSAQVTEPPSSSSAPQAPSALVVK